VFFTLSGSRRNYYVLPLVPFAILLTADWILAKSNQLNKWAGGLAIVSAVTFFVAFDLVQPLYYAKGGNRLFAEELKQTATQMKPWSEWNVILLDPESKLRFYLQLSPFVKNYTLSGKMRASQTEASLLTSWPMLQEKKANAIFVTRKVYAATLKNLLPDYQMIEAQLTWGERLLKVKNENAPVAFVPPLSS